MKKTVITWLAIGLLTIITGRISAQGGPSGPGPPGFPEILPREITLLPALDKRRFIASDQAPDLTGPVSVIMPAELLLGLGLESWNQQTGQGRIRRYQGPLPPGESFHWSEFPLRGLETDMALGLEFTRLDLKHAGHNVWLPLQVVLDSGLMPIYMLGMATSQSNFDVAGRVVPAVMVRNTLRVNLNFLSLKAGGPFFTKTYLLRLDDEFVPNRRLLAGYRPDPRDGQAYGQDRVTELMAALFTWIGRDPELKFLPQLARIAWLRNVLLDPRVEAGLKKDLIRRVSDPVRVPELNQDDLHIFFDPDRVLKNVQPASLWRETNEWEEAGFGELKGLIPTGLGDEAGRLRVLASLQYVLLEAAAWLSGENMVRPLTEDEQSLRASIRTYLARWQTGPASNRLLREVVLSPGRDWRLKQEAFRVLVDHPDILNNENFVRRRLADGRRSMEGAGITRCLEEAALLKTVWHKAGNNSLLSVTDQVLPVLSGEDAWVGPLVLKSLTDGYFDEEMIRLAGALALDRAVGHLLKALKASRKKDYWYKQNGHPPAALWATDSRRQKARDPDPLLLIQALANFKGHPEVLRELRSIYRDWRPGRREELTAAAVLAAGRLDGRAVGPELIKIWADDRLLENPTPLLRRAVLEALIESGDPILWQKVLQVAEKKLIKAEVHRFHRQPPLAEELDILKETAVFFGRLRYAPAVEFLAGLARLPEAGRDRRLAACQALGQIADWQAEMQLTALSEAPQTHLARAGAAGLETLVRERARWAALPRDF